MAGDRNSPENTTGRTEAAERAVAPLEHSLRGMRVWLAGAVGGVTVTAALVIWLFGHFASAEGLNGMQSDIKAVDAAQRAAEKREVSHDAQLRYLRHQVKAQAQQGAWTVKLLWRMAPRNVRDSFPDPPPDPSGDEPKEQAP